jgi:hypothetical protein
VSEGWKELIMTELHVQYAPILRFNKNEQFFPMRVDDMLRYSGLYVKEQPQPIVPRGQVSTSHLTKQGRSSEVFLRSVEAGPLSGKDVVAEWGEGALEMVYRWSAARPTGLAEHLARKAYNWFSPKTKDAAQLFWWNDVVSHLLEGAVQSASRNELPRLVLPSETQQSAVAAYQSSFRGLPPYAYYYRQVRDGHYLCLQYWFFYSYNDWGRRFAGMNDHEGDWEGMMLFFRLDGLGRPQEPPAYVTFADHESRQTKPWGHQDVTCVGTHPVGFVAAGSHATYPEAGTHALMKLYDLFDHATGDGVTIDHDEWVHRIDLDDVRWLGEYKGSWGTRFWLPTAQARTVLQVMLGATPFRGLVGLAAPSEIELPGVSAPHGPVGSHRPQYANPVAWAGVPTQ